MKLAFFMMPLHSLKLSYKEMYDMDVEAALYADQLKFDEFWVGEHVTAKVEPVSNILQFLSALIPQTSHMKLCTGVLNLPQHHPARIAADVAMFDHMSNGRFIMGIGPGGLSTDFEMFGTTEKDRQAMMVEGWDIVQKIWNTEPPYDIQGNYWTVRVVNMYQPDMGLGILPKPLQNPFPRIATSAMSPHSGTAKLAGAKNWDLISANFNAPWVVKSHWDQYVKGADQAGLRADPNTWRVCRSILITDSEQETADYLATPDNTIRSYYNYLFTQLSRAGAIKIFLTAPDAAPESLTLQSVIDSMVIAGSRKTVLDKLVSFMDEVGPFGCLTMAFHEWDRPEMWKGSMRKLREDIMPKLSQHAASKLAAYKTAAE
jgi:alkanesulfonate monooxygenase SsuD/methylene tetrahydromethanopterin reductase-like flavin-dependent oxidoreductase (luciferase family)